jgi:TolB-like protein
MRKLWLLLLLPITVDAAEELPGLAVLNLKAQRGVDASLAEMISEATLSQLRVTRRFKSVIGSSDVAAMISAEQQKQALGCDEDSCLAQLGGALGVPYLLMGSLGRVGSRYMLNIKLLAVEDAKVAGRITQMFATEDAIINGLGLSLTALLSDAFKAAPTASAKRIRPLSQWAGLGLGAVGAGLTAYSFSPLNSAQTAYNTNPTDRTSAAVTTAYNEANVVMTTGLLGVAVGAGLWMWAP